MKKRKVSCKPMEVTDEYGKLSDDELMDKISKGHFTATDNNNNTYTVSVLKEEAYLDNAVVLTNGIHSTRLFVLLFRNMLVRKSYRLFKTTMIKNN